MTSDLPAGLPRVPVMYDDGSGRPPAVAAYIEGEQIAVIVRAVIAQERAEFAGAVRSAIEEWQRNRPDDAGIAGVVYDLLDRWAAQSAAPAAPSEPPTATRFTKLSVQCKKCGEFTTAYGNLEHEAAPAAPSVRQCAKCSATGYFGWCAIKDCPMNATPPASPAAPAPSGADSIRGVVEGWWDNDDRGHGECRQKMIAELERREAGILTEALAECARLREALETARETFRRMSYACTLPSDDFQLATRKVADDAIAALDLTLAAPEIAP